MTAIAALAGGCSRVLISDLSAPKLAIAGQYAGITPVNIQETALKDAVMGATDGWGADVIFEASGSPRAYHGIFDLMRPGGALVLVGLPIEPVEFDVPASIFKEARIETVFRYANNFDRAVNLIASGKVDLKPLITETYAFAESIAAFERAAKGLPQDVKLQIRMTE
jgi:D-xylulose reductase